MKKMMDLGAAAGLVMIILSAGYYDTQLIAGTQATAATFIPAVIGTLLLVLWLNGKAVRRYLRHLSRELPKVFAAERRRRAARAAMKGA